MAEEESAVTASVNPGALGVLLQYASDDEEAMDKRVEEDADSGNGSQTEAIPTVSDEQMEVEHNEGRDEQTPADMLICSEVPTSSVSSSTLDAPLCADVTKIQADDAPSAVIHSSDDTHPCPTEEVKSPSNDVTPSPDDVTIVKTAITDALAYRVRTDSDVISEEELDLVLISDEDSDVEFERILAATAPKKTEKIPKQKKKAVEGGKDIIHEYANFPSLERLQISVPEEVVMQRLGVVKNIVDCLVVVHADTGLAIDIDSVVFRRDRSAIGKVFDIFGQVRSPSYAIRFNTPLEAAEAVKVDEIVFVASNDDYTKTIFTEQLMNQKFADDQTNDDGEDDPAFSDDEAEKAYRAAMRGRKRKHDPAGGRGRGGGGERGRGGEGGRGRGGRGGGGMVPAGMAWPPLYACPPGGGGGRPPGRGWRGQRGRGGGQWRHRGGGQAEYQGAQQAGQFFGPIVDTRYMSPYQ